MTGFLLTFLGIMIPFIGECDMADTSMSDVKIKEKQLIEKFKEVHGDRYDYGEMEYVTARTKIKIKCAEHGVFEQFIGNHLKGHGCQQCYFVEQKFNQSEVIGKFEKVHGNRYDYSDAVYQGMLKKVNIRCPEHGVFQQKAQDHFNGAGCLQCYKDDLAKQREEKKLKILKICEYIYADRYDYSNSVYVSNEIKFTVICKEHGEFEVYPRTHVEGRMCPTCKKEDKAWKQLVKNRLAELNA